MDIITLAEARAQARIEPDNHSEDDLLTLYADSAEELTLGYLNRDLASIYTEYGKIPINIKHAVLMLVAHSYKHREPMTMSNLYAVPYGYDALIKRYMKLV